MHARTITSSDILIVVDIQNDFLAGGSLAVPDGDAVIAPINALAQVFAHVVLTQDWHPAGHVSFASSHSGKVPFDQITLADGRPQALWADHCVQGTPGAELAPALSIPHAELIIRKGYQPDLDSYSAFIEADGTTKTGLAGYLHERGFTHVFVVGLAADFCVGFTAIDAAKAGFAVTVVEDATRGIDTNGSIGRIYSAMHKVGVAALETSALLGPRVTPSSSV